VAADIAQNGPAIPLEVRAIFMGGRCTVHRQAHEASRLVADFVQSWPFVLTAWSFALSFRIGVCYIEVMKNR
jgi:hypothetical protein